jgi:hypothetical protein
MVFVAFVPTVGSFSSADSPLGSAPRSISPVGRQLAGTGNSSLRPKSLQDHDIKQPRRDGKCR